MADISAIFTFASPACVNGTTRRFSRRAAADASVLVMEQGEQAYVTDAGERSRLGQLFTDLANGATPSFSIAPGARTEPAGWRLCC